MTVLALALGLISFLLIWQFVGYPTLMGIVALFAKPREKHRSYTPFVSVIVPAHNEETVIGKRLENLLALDYPDDEYEILVVESGSTDGTLKVVQDAIANRQGEAPPMKLLREAERRGKASAINLGKRHARGDIILVTDANSAFEPNVLREMMPHFADPKVGAVGGRYVVSNPDNIHTSSESFYWDLEYIMRRGESIVDSACLFHGEINAWRKNLAEADTDNLSEDLDIAIQIRRAGYKIEYESSALVYEPGATTARDQIRQRKRTTTGTLQCIFKYRDYLLLPRDLYSLLIFPSHKGLVMLSPLLLVSVAILYLLVRDIGIIVAHATVTFVLFAVLLVVLLSLRSKLVDGAQGPSAGSLTSVPRILYYVLLNEYLVFLAWIDLLLGRYSVLWEKAESTRAAVE
ncbi:MAG: glycosyltransferase [Anaerolineae bacterium]|nr:glycosyltransferase [Anaerolineae bacterium]NIN96887.1 glycosyltransferase [Anaerolineae bacterium]NIQ82741.1 glycosyltransferase [Anaerolineae bacterium]